MYNTQVRRLSDRGGEGPSPREAAFLATLSQGPAPSPGGRRHSVVTISKVPTTLFGRSRRESIAAFPAGGAQNRILGSRRESVSGAVGPPSTEHRGSIHNLQLDIMDDIVTARKVRMKMWNTSNEKVCEVQPLDENTVKGPGPATQRYTQASSLRRYSDFIGTPLAAIPNTKRRASEYPTVTVDDSQLKQKTLGVTANTGIVCSNTDLIFILSNLTSSAMEINQTQENPNDHGKPVSLEQKRNRLKSKRSNSFDVSILNGTELVNQQSEVASHPGPSNWFVKRHQPMSTKKETRDKIVSNVQDTTVTIAHEKQQPSSSTQGKERKLSKDGKETAKVVWDGRSGSLVDAEALGSAIEVFLRRGGAPESSNSPPATTSGVSPSKGAIPKTSHGSTKASSGKSKSSSGWYSNKEADDDTTESCDTSLCSTLKDLFVK